MNLKVSVKWVKEHSKNIHNNEADKLENLVAMMTFLTSQRHSYQTHFIYSSGTKSLSIYLLETSSKFATKLKHLTMFLTHIVSPS